MAFIQTIPVSEATGEVLELYQRQQGPYGYLPNYAKVFCYRPEVMKAWANLQITIRQHLDQKSFELITLAAAQAIHNSYCCLAHSKVLCEKFYTVDEVKAIASNADTSPLTEAEKAMMRLARQVATDSSSINAADIQDLLDLGFSEAKIFDIVSVAAARCFFAKISDALGAAPDAAFLAMDQGLRELLTPGRPIDPSQPEVLS